MRRKGPFVRDVELHGHHRRCNVPIEALRKEGDEPCICRELDYDDWIAAGEAEMDRRREEPRKVIDSL